MGDPNENVAWVPVLLPALPAPVSSRSASRLKFCNLRAKLLDERCAATPAMFTFDPDGVVTAELLSDPRGELMLGVGTSPQSLS